VTPTRPPGWYSDPAGSGKRRYFNGRNWGPITKEGWKDFHEIWLDNTFTDNVSFGPKVFSDDFDGVGQKLCAENE
jgi:hypothetical protein